MFKTKPYSQILKNIDNFNKINFDIPIVCPHCSSALQPIITDYRLLVYDDCADRLLVISYKGNCCFKSFYATYEYSKRNAKLLDVFPHLKPTVLPKNIIDLSPRFASLYEQSYTAEQNGHVELAGSGYRNAIEVLIKDFAIKKLNAPSDEVCGIKLYDAIGKYLKEVNIDTSAADVVRVLGNDYTHYERKYDDIDFIVVKKYLEIFLQQIETKLLLMEPIVSTNRQ